jgi:hypothetical protein
MQLLSVPAVDKYVSYSSQLIMFIMIMITTIIIVARSMNQMQKLQVAAFTDMIMIIIIFDVALFSAV